jgi:hypothetical protein
MKNPSVSLLFASELMGYCSETESTSRHEFRERIVSPLKIYFQKLVLFIVNTDYNALPLLPLFFLNLFEIGCS